MIDKIGLMYNKTDRISDTNDKDNCLWISKLAQQ